MKKAGSLFCNGVTNRTGSFTAQPDTQRNNDMSLDKITLFYLFLFLVETWTIGLHYTQKAELSYWSDDSCRSMYCMVLTQVAYSDSEMTWWATMKENKSAYSRATTTVFKVKCCTHDTDAINSCHPLQLVCNIQRSMCFERQSTRCCSFYCNSKRSYTSIPVKYQYVTGCWPWPLIWSIPVLLNI